MIVEVKNKEKVIDFLDSMPERLFNGIKIIFQDAVRDASNEVKDNCRSILTVRTGTLRRSIGHGVKGDNIKSLRASVYSESIVDGQPLLYAAVHEFGSTIKAKDKYARVPGGPYLNIPTSANKTASGVMRKTARMVFNEGGYLRQKRGKWGVYLGTKKMFSLVKSVKIPPRLGMRKAAESAIETILSSLNQLKLEE